MHASAENGSFFIIVTLHGVLSYQTSYGPSLSDAQGDTLPPPRVDKLAGQISGPPRWDFLLLLLWCFHCASIAAVFSHSLSLFWTTDGWFGTVAIVCNKSHVINFIINYLLFSQPFHYLLLSRCIRPLSPSSKAFVSLLFMVRYLCNKITF